MAQRYDQQNYDYTPSDYQKSKRTGSGIGMLAIGAAVGAVAALLLAPKSGKEMRSDIKGKATDVNNKIKGRTQQVSQKTRELTEKARTRAKDAIDQTADSVQEMERRKSRATA